MTSRCDVLCAGIVVADHVSTPIDHLPTAGELVQADHLRLAIGGCAANVATDLAKMEIDTKVVGLVGEDGFGTLVKEMLQSEGVDVSQLRTTAEAETSQTLIVNVRGEDRRFIHSFGANAHFSASDLPVELVQQCKILYVGGYLVMPALKRDELAQVFQSAQTAGVKTVLDVVVPGPGEHLEQLENLLPFVDVFLPNDHEGELILGEREPRRQAERFHQMGAKTCVVTLGAEGVVVVSANEKLRASGFEVEMIDGSGGGDAFAAGYVCGMLRDGNVEECLRLGSALGASCVQAIGTTTGVFTRSQCEAFLSERELKIEKL